VQQNSSLTYRVYDYDRLDKNGNKRQLHVEKAMAVANLNKYEIPTPCRNELLGKCNYFSVYKFTGKRVVGMADSFVCLTVINGQISLGDLTLIKGESAFISATESAQIKGDGTYILTCVEKN
jgi:mannose-6-phosphate isomerase